MKWCLAVCLCACTTGEAYLVDRGAIEQLKTVTEKERADSAIPAVRVKDKTPTTVYVRGSTFELDKAKAMPDGKIRVRGSMPSKMVTAGSVLTWVGSALSIGGAILLFATINQGDDGKTLQMAGGFTALAAEPLMWTGTALWIVGAKKRPQEVAAPLP